MTQQQQHRNSNSSEAAMHQSPFEVFQKLLLDPLSACYPDEAIQTVEDIREWSASRSNSRDSTDASLSRNRSQESQGSSFFYGKHYSHDQDDCDSDQDDQEDVTLNGLIDDTMSHKSTKTASTFVMAREHSSTSRHSNDSSSEYGIPMLRDLPSFGTHSFMSGIGGSQVLQASSPSRYTAVSEASSLISEYETKLPNINTMRKPINPVMLP